VCLVFLALFLYLASPREKSPGPHTKGQESNPRLRNCECTCATELQGADLRKVSSQDVAMFSPLVCDLLVRIRQLMGEHTLEDGAERRGMPEEEILMYGRPRITTDQENPPYRGR